MTRAPDPTDAPDQAARVAGLFDALSSTYDSVGVDFFGPIAEGLLAAMPPRAGERWLDVGCGRGAVLLPAARAVGPEGRAVGVDIAPGMVEQARRLAAERGLDHVELVVGDATAPAVTGPFDAVTSSLVLFFLPDPGAALRSWVPLMAAGARLGVVTFGPVDPRWAFVDDVFAPYLPPALPDARTSGATGPFGSDEAMEQLVTDSGYVDVRTVTRDLPVRFADAEQWHAWTWSIGQRAMWLAVPPEQRPDVLGAAQRRLASYAEPDGSITFVQSVRYTLASAG
ncbi:MAG TPA: methyltransferase domain-containing protein [Candidatus Nanopelagicales bacterium]